jgi:basic amino acid/polyamine antiporter, APA family
MHAPVISPARSLGLVSGTAMVIASMIGTGVFTTSGFLLADLQSPWLVLLAWFIGGLLAMFGALSYGALARHIPESGGEYIFLSRTVHPSAGYIAGWISLLVGFSAPMAAAAYGFGEYTKSWFPGMAPKATGSWLILLFCFLHAANVPSGARIQNATVILKVALILLFLAFAFPRLNHFPVETFSGAGLPAFGVSLVWISFCYSGWNAAVYIGSEMKEPEKTLPLSLVLGTGVVIALYLALNAAFLFSTPAENLAGKLEIGRIAASALGGPLWAESLTLLIALALATSVSSMMMAGPRVYARMAGDGYLPSWMAPSAGPPRAAIFFQCLVALLMLWTATFQSLLTYIGFTLGLSTAATVVGLMRLKAQQQDKLPVAGWPIVPILFLFGVLGITGFSIAQRPVESAFGLLTIAIGWLAWRVTGKTT